MALLDRGGDEVGLSLMEVLVASVLTLVVMIMGFQILSSGTKTAAAVGNRVQNSTNARLAIDSLEANLRFSNAVWVCGPAATGLPCTASTVTLFVHNDTGNTPGAGTGSGNGSVNNPQPLCAQWTVSVLIPSPLPSPLPTLWPPLSSLNETSSNTPAVGGVHQPIAITQGTTTFNGSTGFSLPMATLVQIDLSVNQETVNVVASDAVSVHDLIAPNNLTTAQAPTPATPATPCTP